MYLSFAKVRSCKASFCDVADQINIQSTVLSELLDPTLIMNKDCRNKCFKANNDKDISPVDK